MCPSKPEGCFMFYYIVEPLDVDVGPKVFSTQKGAWQTNGTGAIGDEATVGIPNGYAFLSALDTRRFMEIQGNLPTNNAYAIGPKNLRWFALFKFEPIGYVRDDEKIDPDELLQTLQENNKDGLEERKSKGLPLLYLLGWYVPPHYDVQTRRLEWGTKLRSEQNGIIVNYTIKILGRGGVMDAVLVSDPTLLDSDIREFKGVLNGYSFSPGSRYAEFRSGDKIAEYGLSALIVGGAAAAVVKSGALKGLIKFLWVGIAAVVAGVGGTVKRLFGAGSRKSA
jgi:uncharacterized membrane-anchored protein